MGKIADIFESGETYLAISKITHKPYISQKGECYAFTSEEKINKFISSHSGTDSEYGWHKPDKLKADCFQAGGSILVLSADDKTKESYPLRKKDLELRYYNHQLSMAASYIKLGYDIPLQLKRLTQCRFIVPCRIKDGDGISVTYAIAAKEGDRSGFKYVAFTSLEEYKTWENMVAKTDKESARHDSRWQPFEIDYSAMHRISRRHGIVIDPMSMMLVIPSCRLPDVLEEDDV